MIRLAQSWIVFGAFLPGAFAGTFYVDPAGSDNHDGLTADSAWQTMSRAQSSGLQPGDTVLLRRGAVWNERLNISRSGTPDRPITFGSFGVGPRPILDGSSAAGSLILITGVTDIQITGLAIRNAPRFGINVLRSERVTLRDLEVSNSRGHGILLFESSTVGVEYSDIHDNGLDTTDSFDGIRIDGDIEVVDVRVVGTRIYRQIGGQSWRSGNGIFLGHTGGRAPVLRQIVIRDNEIFENGNPDQNQAGRGISGTFDGDASIVSNRVIRNASAGIYLDLAGVNAKVTIANNAFRNNALRQFGGLGAGRVVAEGNVVVVDDPTITAMGVEIGGPAKWTITSNVFCYLTPTADSFRAFVRVFDEETEAELSIDSNFYYSAGPHRWIRPNGVISDFRAWQAAGFDQRGRSAR